MGQDLDDPTVVGAGFQIDPKVCIHVKGGKRIGVRASCGKFLIAGFIILNRQSNLFDVADTLNSPGGLAGLLYGRQQESDQNADDGDDDQQLDQRKTM
jgi:hypothetical protein